MNIKNFLLLSLLIMLIPACRQKPRYAPAPAVTSEPVPVQKTEFDEELGAFVVKDDQNAFSAAAAAQVNQEEELTRAASEPTAGDMHSDSSQYGLKTVFFEFNKYRIDELRPDQKPVLEQDADIVKSLANKGYKISIEGHACDSAGSTEYNMMLSEDRARAVADYFKAAGVQAELYTVGHGCAHLLVPSGTREQQAPNRRVEIYAYPSTEKPSMVDMATEAEIE